MSRTFVLLLFLLVALATLRAGGQQMFNPKMLGPINHGPGRFSGIYVGGEKRYAGRVILPGRQLNARAKEISKQKVEHLGKMLKRQVENLRHTSNDKAELVFLVDSSASVGAENFFKELEFVKKLLADFTVDRNTTRVCVVTFSLRSRVASSNTSTI